MLYIVATPIGNLQDITLRAIETLKSVDVILCEDTRHSKQLTDHFGIDKKLISLHQHSSGEKIKSLLSRFENIAYVSDAGTPGISDPGGKLVEAANNLGIEVVPIPGACAVIAALSISGLPTDKYNFIGFMPHKGRAKIMESIRDSKVTICFFESPHRILKTLEQLKDYLAEDRKVVVGRELTKKFETIYRGNIREVFNQVKEMPKGEFVIIVSSK